jgi:fructose-1-phosphate kinase PfkB-like protein
MGAAAVLTPGTELCRRTDVEKLLNKVKIEEIPQRKR